VDVDFALVVVDGEAMENAVDVLDALLLALGVAEEDDVPLHAPVSDALGGIDTHAGQF
jgi:hypothetical protein